MRGTRRAAPEGDRARVERLPRGRRSAGRPSPADRLSARRDAHGRPRGVGGAHSRALVPRLHRRALPDTGRGGRRRGRQDPAGPGAVQPAGTRRGDDPAGKLPGDLRQHAALPVRCVSARMGRIDRRRQHRGGNAESRQDAGRVRHELPPSTWTSPVPCSACRLRRARRPPRRRRRYSAADSTNSSSGPSSGWRGDGRQSSGSRIPIGSTRRRRRSCTASSRR